MTDTNKPGENTDGLLGEHLEPLSPEEFERRLLSPDPLSATKVLISSLIGRAGKPPEQTKNGGACPRLEHFKTEKEYHAAMRDYFTGNLKSLLQMAADSPLPGPGGIDANVIDAFTKAIDLIGWADIEDSEVRIPKEGAAFGVMAFVPTESPYRNGQFMKLNDDEDVLFIEPFPLSKTWSAMGMSGGLSMLGKKVEQKMKFPDGNASEDWLYRMDVGAYRIQLVFLDQINKGAFTKKLKQIIAEYDLRDSRDVTNLFSENRFQEIVRALNALVPENPESDQEKFLRIEFYHVILILQLAYQKAKAEGKDYMLAQGQALKHFREASFEARRIHELIKRRQEETNDPEREKLLYDGNIGRIRKRFDEGFEEFCALLPDKMPDEGDRLRGLAVLKDLRKKVLWTKIENNTYISLVGGEAAGYMAVIPFGHNIIKKHPNHTISVESGEEKTFLQLGPGEISKPWSAIELVYGLGIMYARLMGIEPRNATREQFMNAKILAVESEIMAADVISGGKFIDMMTKMIEKYRIENFEDIDKRRRPDLMRGVSADFDRVIYPHKPLSVTEEKLRGGVYLNALVLGLAWKIAAKTGRQHQNILRELLEKLEASR